MSSVRMHQLFVAAVFFLLAIVHLAQGQSLAPSPSATSDSKTIDQGIAYVLLLVALAITYIFH